MTMSGHKAGYRNAPIEEALVEIRVVPSADYDLTVPGKLHERVGIKDFYSGKPRTQRVMAPVEPPPGDASGTTYLQEVLRAQLVDATSTKMLSVSKDTLTLHSVRPYEGWQSLRPRIEAALTAYGQVTGATEVVRIGVRYINRISLPVGDVELQKFFRYGLSLVPELPRTLGAFFARSEHTYADGAKLVVIHAPVVAEANAAPAFVLDLDVIKEFQQPISLANAMGIVDDLHAREKIAFEALITDETRRLFDAV